MPRFAPAPSSTGLTTAGVLIALVLALAAPAAAFTLEIDGTPCTWDVVGRFVLPHDTVRLAVDDTLGAGWTCAGGALLSGDSAAAAWEAPDRPGVYPLVVTVGAESRLVNAIVMVPYDSLKNGDLKGYRVGRYPASNPFPNFTRPRGFIEITEDNIDTRVSPRHTLREFVPRQPGSYPKYLALQEALILKLELLADLVQNKGYRCDRLTVFSGFRTPAYNARYGSGTNSAHIYGGAADLYLDADGDGMMDDLNGDGSASSGDAKLLVQFVDELEQLHPELVGGCGWYRRARTRGPFVHTDVRGERTRWHR